MVKVNVKLLEYKYVEKISAIASPEHIYVPESKSSVNGCTWLT